MLNRLERDTSLLYTPLLLLYPGLYISLHNYADLNPICDLDIWGREVGVARSMSSWCAEHICLALKGKDSGETSATDEGVY